MPKARPRRSAGEWTPQRVLASSSPVVGKDIHAFLVQCISGWDINYDESEKKAIIDTLPSAYQTYELDDSGKLKCPVALDFVFDDPFIKSGIARFKSDVADGFYEKTWQTQAKRAMEDRRQGKFDEYLRNTVEDNFGEIKPDEVERKAEVEIEVEALSSDGEWLEKPSTWEART